MHRLAQRPQGSGAGECFLLRLNTRVLTGSAISQLLRLFHEPILFFAFCQQEGDLSGSAFNFSVCFPNFSLFHFSECLEGRLFAHGGTYTLFSVKAAVNMKDFEISPVLNFIEVWIGHTFHS